MLYLTGTDISLNCPFSISLVNNIPQQFLKLNICLCHYEHRNLTVFFTLHQEEALGKTE
jgi:hypothetical protein